MKIMLDGTLENGLNAQYSTPSFLCESGQDCIAFWWYVYLPQLRYSVGSNLRLDSTNFKVVISQHADEIVNAFEH